MSYVAIMMEYLKKTPYFTCQDIMDETNTTCPHSVVRDLRRKCYISSEEKRTPSGKRYFQYKFEGLINA